jgi:CDP-alcohol phosphatidyltransferase
VSAPAPDSRLPHADGAPGAAGPSGAPDQAGPPGGSGVPGPSGPAGPSGAPTEAEKADKAPPPGLMNVANALTVARICLVPVFVVCLAAGGTWWRLAALAAFGAASLTDLLDGELARRRGLVTDFGKIADPTRRSPGRR